MSVLLTKQLAFGAAVGALILKASELGYGVKLGEVQRTIARAKLNAASGAGISNSLHIKNLAIDLLLFKDGVYLTKSDEYRVLGLWWEQTFAGAAWGGRWGDGNHFSFTHEGVK